MKAITLLLALVISTTVAARQYIQCADSHSWDRAVVNLNGERSTLFMTNGVHLPDSDRLSILKDLKFDSEDETHLVYKTEGKIIDIVRVPKEIIGEYSSNFKVEFSHHNTQSGYTSGRDMYCFSAIYED